MTNIQIRAIEFVKNDINGERVTNCLIEKAIEADPTWAAAHVPWEDRRALNDEGA